MAKSFNDELDLTGVLLTKMDGDGSPINSRGNTKADQIYCCWREAREPEAFHPERIASRILGMGDLVYPD